MKPIPQFDLASRKLSISHLNRLVDACNAFLNMQAGPGIVLHRTPHGIAIASSASERNKKPSAGGNIGFWAKITAYTGDGTNRWKYLFAEVQKTANGYSGWNLVSGGRTGTARNTLEYINDGSGTQGNGVCANNLNTANYTFEIEPCPVGNVIWLRAVAAEDTVEYWFQYANGVDGSCD